MSSSYGKKKKKNQYDPSKSLLGSEKKKPFDSNYHAKKKKKNPKDEIYKGETVGEREKRLKREKRIKIVEGLSDVAGTLKDQSPNKYGELEQDSTIQYQGGEQKVAFRGEEEYDKNAKDILRRLGSPYG